MIYAYFGKCELRYFGLFVAENDATAIRIVEEELQRNKKLSDYCSEYSLYSLCDFNEDSAEMSNCSARFVSDLSDILIGFLCKQRKQNELLSRVSGIPLDSTDDSIDKDVIES